MHTFTFKEEGEEEEESEKMYLNIANQSSSTEQYSTRETIFKMHQVCVRVCVKVCLRGLIHAYFSICKVWCEI